jgi:hypothetical protein
MNNRSRAPLLVTLTIVLALAGLAPQRVARAGGSPNGVAGGEPTYYDANLLRINLMLLSSGITVLAHNSQTNIIWQSDGGLPGGQPFISVINAIPADGFNPLWDECQITFNPGHTPRQFFSDTEVEAAAASGEITVTDTHELYRCSVIGKPATSSASLSGPSTASSMSSPTAASHVTHATSWARIKAAFH